MLKCRTQGGKGNDGMFIERDPKVIAAGKPSPQANETIADHLKYYQLQDEVEALVHDAIIPQEKILSTTPKHRDMRHAGIYTDGRELVNPPQKTKFQQLVEDLKSTAYASYWKKPIGKGPDQAPLLPKGFNPETTTMGIRTVGSEDVYNLITPKYPIPDGISPSKRPGYQTSRNYRRPPYNPNNNFGVVCNPGQSTLRLKCCLTDDRVGLGTSNFSPICTVKADFKQTNAAFLGLPMSPNNNISCVPPGYAFGKLEPSNNLPECLSTCELNTGKQFFMKCLAHLNNMRKCLSKRFDATFFLKFYLRLKHMDKTISGWLPKQVVYDLCATKCVRFNPSLIEPLLEMWNAFDGYRIGYETFVRVINYRIPSPNLPKIEDIPSECLDFSTKYREMMKPNQEADKRFRAGIPTGRYFDTDYPITPNGNCKAVRICLPDESDARSCLNPSTFTLLGVSHRDMYAARSPEIIRRVFEAATEPMTNERFNELWEEAKKYHSKGWVSFETFRKAFYKDHVEQ